MFNCFLSQNSIEFSRKTLKSMMLMSISSVSMIGFSLVAYGQTSTASGVGFTCTSDTDQNFNLRPNSTPIRSTSPNAWTYNNVMTLGGVNYDLKVTQVGARSTGGYSVDETASLNLQNWNPRLGPYVILEYELFYSDTGQPATLDKFNFVQGDIDGQDFKQGIGDNMLEIIGFQTGQYDSISFGGGLGYRGFQNGKNTPTGYRTIRQQTPSNVKNNSHDISISYSNRSSFRIMYGMSAQKKWTNRTTRNFFFRAFSGVINANTVFPCAADYSDAPTAYGDTLHKIDNSLLLGAAITGEDTAGNDGNAGSDDSDDGVTIPVLKQGESTVITADVTGASGHLQGWIDFNGNRTFEASEQIAANLQDGDKDGQISISVNVPSDAVTTQTFARFRWSKTADLDAPTTAIDGEVEDYAVTIAPADADLVTLKTLSSGDNTPDEGDTVAF